MIFADNSVVNSAVEGADASLANIGLVSYVTLMTLLKNIISASDANDGDSLVNAISDAREAISSEAGSFRIVDRIAYLARVINSDLNEFGDDATLVEWANAVSCNTGSTINAEAVEFLWLTKVLANAAASQARH
jgi:hypothetical protein